jgi:hypothetical protein
MELKIQNIHENSSQKLNIKKSSPVQSSGWMDGWMDGDKKGEFFVYLQCPPAVSRKKWNSRLELLVPLKA